MNIQQAYSEKEAAHFPFNAIKQPTPFSTVLHQKTTLAAPRQVNKFPLSYGSGFGGLWVACWPLVPKFAGSNPAEAVGFLGRKNPQHAFLRRGSKAVGPMS